MKVAIVGASGFVGSSVVEKLRARGDIAIVPCIHTSGNAGQIARLGIPLTQLDLLDRDAVRSVVAGCTHVVNCSRGTDEVMLKGLHNLLDACRNARVQGLVHLSSVAVYGDPPSPDSTSEEGQTAPEAGTYGWTKLAQDRMVAEAASAGLPATVLCPPNISGVQSVFLGIVVKAMQSGELALMDAGSAPCNLVDVHNLVHAIVLSLERGPGDGKRIFITDDDRVTWAEVVTSLGPLTKGVRIPAITREELARLASPSAPNRVSVRRSLLHLVSSDVRQALRKDPLWAKLDSALRNSVRVLGGSVEDRMRLTVEGPAAIERHSSTPAYNIRLSAQQLRNVVHTCERARRVLGYRPLYTFEQSMAAFRRWYRVFHGWDTPAAPLLQGL